MSRGSLLNVTGGGQIEQSEKALLGPPRPEGTGQGSFACCWRD